MIKSLISSQEIKNKLEFAKELQNSMDSRFLEHTMYDINDALTSILALCDMEQVKSVPRIKKYIERINILMKDIRIYSKGSDPNVDHILNNVINTVKKINKENIKINYSFGHIQGCAKIKKKNLEYVLLYTLLEFTNLDGTTSIPEISIQLVQKEKDIQITIVREGFRLSEMVIKEIKALNNNEFKGKVEIIQRDHLAKAFISIPFSMKTEKKTYISSVISNINITKKKPVYNYQTA